MIRMISSALKSLVRLVLVILLTPYKLAKYLARGVMPASRTSTSWLWWVTREMLMVPVWVIRAFLKEIWTIATTTSRTLLSSPRATYTKAMVLREWLLVKVEMLQRESERWQTTFKIIMMPYTILTKYMGFSPQWAATALAATTVATTGVVGAQIIDTPTFENGAPGIYADFPSNVPSFYEPETFNTLRVDLAGISIGSIVIEDLNLGTSYAGSSLPANETSVILVGGKPTVQDPAFTETFLIASHVIIDRWRCLTLTLSNIEANTLIVRGNLSDGQSIAAIPGTPIMRGVGGGNRADDLHTRGGTYDQLKLQASASGVNSEVDLLHLTNLYTRGACVIDRLKVGTLEVVLNTTGGDSDLETKALQIEDTVVYKTFINEENREQAMAAPAVQ